MQRIFQGESGIFKQLPENRVVVDDPNIPAALSLAAHIDHAEVQAVNPLVYIIPKKLHPPFCTHGKSLISHRHSPPKWLYKAVNPSAFVNYSKDIYYNQ